MKRTLYINSVILLSSVIMLSSCAKTYTCTCETNDGFVTTSDISEGSQEDSEAACKDMEYTHSTTLNGITTTTVNVCELK